MSEHQIVAKEKRKFVATTDSKHNQPIAPNLLEREFQVQKANEGWVGDISYVWTKEGWLYLAVVLELYSRKVVGWAMKETMKTELVLDALAMATQNRKLEPGAIFHSDRGSQYASNEYRAELEQVGMRASMSRKGDCWDNAVAESFFGTLKNELVNHRVFESRAEAMSAIFEYIEVFYNRKRRHSTIGYLSPVEFERVAQSESATA
jgi:transposase InsO family protein